MSEIQAAEYMKEIVYKAADNWFTNWYDKIQWIQQKIYHWFLNVDCFIWLFFVLYIQILII